MSNPQSARTQEEQIRYDLAMQRLKSLSIPRGWLDFKAHRFEVKRKGHGLGRFSTFAGAVYHAEYNAHFQEQLEVRDVFGEKLLAVVSGIGRVEYTDLGANFGEDSHAAFDGSFD